jgi:hypothetical protein
MSLLQPWKFPWSPAQLEQEICFQFRSLMEQFCSCWRLLSLLRNILCFMECEGSLRCSQGLASDPVLSYHCTLLFRYNISCNNCTIIRYWSAPSYSKLPTSFYFFLPSAGRYSTNQNIALSIPVVVRSKAWVCCHSITGIAGSNPAEGRFFYSCECLCQVEVCDGSIICP